MSTKFKVIIEDGGNPEEGISRSTIDCENLTEAVQQYRNALDNHEQSQITLARVLP